MEEQEKKRRDIRKEAKSMIDYVEKNLLKYSWWLPSIQRIDSQEREREPKKERKKEREAVALTLIWSQFVPSCVCMHTITIDSKIEVFIPFPP